MKAKQYLSLALLCTLTYTAHTQRYFEFKFTYHPVSENFIVKTSDPTVIAEALAELALPETDRIIMIFGPIAYGNDGYNHSWNWHFIADNWFLTGGNYEVCDGLSSFIDEEPGFWIDTLGYFCPWYAHLSQEVFLSSSGTVIKPQMRVNVSPNPFSEHTTVQWENQYRGEYRLTLLNQLGETVREVNHITGNQVTIERNDLQPGIYYYQLHHGNTLCHTGKLVLQ